MIVAVDPGSEDTAWVLYNGERPVAFAKEPNAAVLEKLLRWNENGGTFAFADELAIEMIASYGMPVGREVFETCVWIGRFAQASGRVAAFVYRKDVKLHLTGSPRAKDGNIRQALIDRWGGKDKAIGKKKTPGPLYGISADVWAALAVAVTFADCAISSQQCEAP